MRARFGVGGDVEMDESRQTRDTHWKGIVNIESPRTARNRKHKGVPSQLRVMNN